jgi:hypothetical protein
MSKMDEDHRDKWRVELQRDLNNVIARFTLGKDGTPKDLTADEAEDVALVLGTLVGKLMSHCGDLATKLEIMESVTMAINAYTLAHESQKAPPDATIQ